MYAPPVDVATDKLFAIAGGSVYDATSSGAVGAAVLTGLSNSRWGYCNIATAGGNFLSMANGVDAPRNYNGSTWSTPTITGVTATTLRDPILYAERQFFIQDNSLKVWYLGVDSIAGAAAAVDIAPFMTKGGYIVAHGTWTIDAGQGVNDHYVIMTNKGQIIVYQGIDPTSITTWSMVGVWDIGAPIGRRSLYKYAGDMLIICQDGVVPLSGALQSSRVQPRVAITDKIQFAISEAVHMAQQLKEGRVLWFNNEEYDDRVLRKLWSCTLKAPWSRVASSPEKAEAAYLRKMNNDLERIKLFDVRGLTMSKLKHICAREDAKLALLNPSTLFILMY